ncbi:hypothetical protein KTD33_00465 [Burkholderia gladioli]|uniref:hypothetical protein n=1 Tax=Burkholderia gladioli TaxID=28095 RepID=UPI001C2220DB|nr:hypothetical protein [Burkholderia gladioli]MBU9193002.1 hypothetical protein [Burkholderia gladioli]
MNVAPLDQRRGRALLAGPRAVAALVRRIKRQLPVLLVLLISGCSAASRPRLAADLPSEWVPHDAARRDLAHRDGVDASVFADATGELASSLDARLSTAHPALPPPVLPTTLRLDAFGARQDAAGQDNRAMRMASTGTTRGGG